MCRKVQETVAKAADVSDELVKLGGTEDVKMVKNVAFIWFTSEVAEVVSPSESLKKDHKEIDSATAEWDVICATTVLARRSRNVVLKKFLEERSDNAEVWNISISQSEPTLAKLREEALAIGINCDLTVTLQIHVVTICLLLSVE